MKVKYKELNNGDIVMLHGYEFTVYNLTYEEDRGKTRVLFKARCTANKVNDDIRHTAYNEGNYAGYEECDIERIKAVNAIGIQVPALFRAFLVEAGIPHDKALELGERFNDRLEEVDWLSTDTGVTFDLSYKPGGGK